MPDSSGFYDDDTEDEEVVGDTNPMKQLRAHARKLERDLKAGSTELEELRKYRTDSELRIREQEAGKVFAELGLSEKQAKLFLKTNPDTEVTKDSIKEFAVEYGLGIQQSEEDDAVDSQTSDTFVPVTSGGTPVRNVLNREQFESLKRTDMAAAVKAVQEGRVEGFRSKLDGSSAVTFG